MSDGQSAPVLRRQREPRNAETDENLSDRQLLERFVAEREQCAFAALVQRHGPMVLAVCRRVLRNEHDAEDAFQAVFLVLARKAGVARWRESLRPWLREAAYRLALHARAARRRRERERSLNACPPECGSPDAALPERCHSAADPLEEVARRELRRVLADEVLRLPRKYREPVVLCYLQGKTNEEAARELGWPAGSMSRRLARARELLRERLILRGLTFSLAILSLLLFALWMLRGGGGIHPPRNGEKTETARSFHATPHGVRGIEMMLARLTEDGRVAAGPEREALAGMARQTAAFAERLQRQDPGRRQREWQRDAEQMRGASLDLARGLDERDEPSTVLSARRLHASCQKCHAIFRE